MVTECLPCCKEFKYDTITSYGVVTNLAQPIFAFVVLVEALAHRYYVDYGLAIRGLVEKHPGNNAFPFHDNGCRELTAGRFTKILTIILFLTLYFHTFNTIATEVRSLSDPFQTAMLYGLF